MKKNVMTAIVSGAMVGCLAIGGTFAYLTANSGTVKNTFTGAASLGVEIKETATDKDTYDVTRLGSDTKLADNATESTPWLGAGAADDGFVYSDVVPGAVIAKDVDVQVTENPTPSYLFVKVTGESDQFKTNIDTAKWSEVDATNHIYVRLNDNGGWAVVDSKTSAQQFGVFETVTVASDLTEIPENVQITVTSAIVQATGDITHDDALKAAQDLLN